MEHVQLHCWAPSKLASKVAEPDFNFIFIPNISPIKNFVVCIAYDGNARLLIIKRSFSFRMNGIPEIVVSYLPTQHRRRALFTDVATTSHASGPDYATHFTNQHSSVPPRMLNKPTLQTFTLFPRLPRELQLHIWSLIFTERRLIPVYCTPSSGLCALIRFLRPQGEPRPDDEQFCTKVLPSIKSAPYACRDAFDIFNRLYRSMCIMRSDRKFVDAKYSPELDVVFFKMGLSSKFHTSLSLSAFTKSNPEVTKSVRKIALETIGNVEELLPVFRSFEKLEEVVTVLPRRVEDGEANDWPGGYWRGTDAADNVDGCDQQAWELGLRIEKTEGVKECSQSVQAVLQGGLARLRNEKWHDWEIPLMRVVEHWEDILGN